MVTAVQVKEALSHKGTTFAQVKYRTKVATAAAFKDKLIEKRVNANVQLFASISDAKKVYEAAVKRSAEKLDQDATAFEAQSNYFEHTDVFSVVTHKTTGKEYLYAIFNNADSEYYVDGVLSSKENVLQYLTPSAQKKLMDDSGVVENKTFNIEHTVQVRTIGLENIQEIKVNHQIVS